MSGSAGSSSAERAARTARCTTPSTVNQSTSSSYRPRRSARYCRNVASNSSIRWSADARRRVDLVPRAHPGEPGRHRRDEVRAREQAPGGVPAHLAVAARGPHRRAHPDPDHRPHDDVEQARPRQRRARGRELGEQDRDEQRERRLPRDHPEHLARAHGGDAQDGEEHRVDHGLLPDEREQAGREHRARRRPDDGGEQGRARRHHRRPHQRQRRQQDPQPVREVELARHEPGEREPETEAHRVLQVHRPRREVGADPPPPQQRGGRGRPPREVARGRRPGASPRVDDDARGLHGDPLPTTGSARRRRPPGRGRWPPRRRRSWRARPGGGRCTTRGRRRRPRPRAADRGRAGRRPCGAGTPRSRPAAPGRRG